MRKFIDAATAWYFLYSSHPVSIRSLTAPYLISADDCRNEDLKTAGQVSSWIFSDLAMMEMDMDVDMDL